MQLAYTFLFSFNGAMISTASPTRIDGSGGPTQGGLDWTAQKLGHTLKHIVCIENSLHCGCFTAPPRHLKGDPAMAKSGNLRLRVCRSLRGSLWLGLRSMFLTMASGLFVISNLSRQDLVDFQKSFSFMSTGDCSLKKWCSKDKQQKSKRDTPKPT